MRIAFVGQPIDFYAPPIRAGSIPIWTYQVARRIVPHHRVVVYARQAVDQPLMEDSEGIRYRRVAIGSDEVVARGMRLFERLLNYPRPQQPSYTNRFFFPTYIRQIARMLREDQPSIVHLFNYTQFIPVIRALNPTSKLVLHMHCEWLSQLEYTMIDRRLHQVDAILGCSDYVTEKVQNRFPHHADRCWTIYNGVDFEYFQTSSSRVSSDSVSHVNGNRAMPNENGNTDNRTKRLLFVGRVSPEKGIHILLQAMHTVVEHFPHVHLDVVGTPGDLPYEYIVLLDKNESVSKLAQFYPGILRRGNYYASLHESARSLTNHVTFVGGVPHDTLAEYYRNADILVNPSLSESFGMSLIEAMATNVPVVVSRVGGMNDIVQHGENGLFVEADHPDGLAKALLDLLQNDQKRLRMAHSGKASITARFSWTHVTESLLSTYESVCRQPPMDSLAKGN